MNALETVALSRRRRRVWALRDCDLAVPEGAVTALVGANGAGKTTLLHVAVGLLAPTDGEILVFGRPSGRRGADLARVAFVAQEKPLFGSFTVAEMLRFANATNPGFDLAAARARIAEADIDPRRRAARLSGGQRTLVALALALGKRAGLLLLDEPLAELDPLARLQVRGALMAAVAETGATVVLSSHDLAELAETCDHLVLLDRGRVRLAGEVEALRDRHRVITGPGEAAADVRELADVVHQSGTERQTTALIRTHLPDLPLGERPGIEEIVLGYLRRPEAP
ncbi:ABC transporter ATP-binding protein [Glycomyces paridis]|uniref:ABC transporter ATP-binding protein n=1 Tax=Glycomyces paridis TaxID=2126555 RepID=A0A4S8PHR8_9ACTN|nr:ABC transporter ATP-binding protein [Glycomyces paridis]THV29501.1 ABC transporter ATP-binding protein [Glycomyces paridis]